MSPRAAVLCALAAAVPSLAAQERPAPPVFPSEAGVVTVDVVVTDGRGVPVSGLGREDFVVYEDGKEQPLALFEAIEAPAPVPEPAAGSATEPAAPVARSRTADPARPTLVVVFDERHLSPASVEQVRRRLRDVWAAEGLGRADVLLASTTTGGTWRASLPEDADAVGAALQRFAGGRPPAGTRRITDYEAFLIAARRDERVLIEVYRRYLNDGLMPDPTIPGMQPRTRGVR